MKHVSSVLILLMNEQLNYHRTKDNIYHDHMYVMEYITYLNICVIDLFERPFITFKFITNNITERIFVLDPS